MTRDEALDFLTKRAYAGCGQSHSLIRKVDEARDVLLFDGPVVAGNTEALDAPPRTLTSAELERLFTYQPPTDETSPKYARIDDAMSAAVLVMDRHTADVVMFEHDARQSDAIRLAFEPVRQAFLAFATVINETCPESADKTAAIRCVRLARNAVNEWLCQARRRTTSKHLLELAHDELMKARWQANASIALEASRS